MAGLSPRRLARYHKINPHIVLPHHGDSIWLDGSFQLRDSPIDFLSHFQEDIELGCYNHTERRCVYSEYRSCIRLRKDDIGLMTAQVARYREAKYPENAGLTETGIIYRKNCPSVQSFNTLWWAEVAKGSHRDQLSFDYCLWKQSWVCPLKVVRFPGSVYLNPLTAFYRHR
jgi:hypothetical protein